MTISDTVSMQNIKGNGGSLRSCWLQRICLLMAVQLALLWMGCTNQTQRIPIVFNDVHVIDAVDSLRSNMRVVVTGDRITEIGSTSVVEIPANATVVEGQGQYLIPGLWDAHVHLSYDRHLTASMFPLFLINGVTSIRDTGGQLHLVMPWKEKSMQDIDTTPRLMVAGPLLDGVPRVYDGGPNRPNLGVGADSPDEAVQIVDSLVQAGVDLIKSYELLTPEAFSAVMDRAQHHGMNVTGHVPLSVDVIEVSNQGLNSMEHLRNLEMACAANHAALLEERRRMLAEGRSHMRGGALRSRIHDAQRMPAIQNQDEARCRRVLGVLAENETWQIPTLALITRSANRPYARDTWRDQFRFLPDSVGQSWEQRAAEAASEPVDPDAERFRDWVMGMVAELKRAGVDMMAGTDTPIGLLTPGFSLHEELALLVRGGLTPLEAIASATLRPAQYFELDDELGRIDRGMRADLVLLEANPLDDIRNTRSIRAVMKDGRLHGQAALDRIRRQLENAE